MVDMSFEKIEIQSTCLQHTKQQSELLNWLIMRSNKTNTIVTYTGNLDYVMLGNSCFITLF